MQDEDLSTNDIEWEDEINFLPLIDESLSQLDEIPEEHLYTLLELLPYYCEFEKELTDNLEFSDSYRVIFNIDFFTMVNNHFISVDIQEKRKLIEKILPSFTDFLFEEDPIDLISNLTSSQIIPQSVMSFTSNIDDCLKGCFNFRLFADIEEDVDEDEF